MNIRPYEGNDIARIQQIHKDCGFDYQLPDLSSPLCVVKKVIEDGEVEMAAIVRLTSEVYLLTNPKWRTPGWRWQALKRLHEEVLAEMRNLQPQPEELCCWMPPEIEKRFGKRLFSLGWKKQQWPTFSKVINA